MAQASHKAASRNSKGITRPSRARAPSTSVSALTATRFAAWLAQHVDGFSGPLTVEQFAGGQSNPTFKLVTPLASLRDAREAWTCGEIAAVRACRRARISRDACACRHGRAGRATCSRLCEDESVIGRAFYVMEFVEGRVLWDQSLPGMSANERAAVYDEMNRVIAALRSVEPDERRAFGLRQAGQLLRASDRPLEQAVCRVRNRTHRRDAAPDRMAAAALCRPRRGKRASIVHGDYRLDNLDLRSRGTESACRARLGVVDARRSARGLRLSLHGVARRSRAVSRHRGSRLGGAGHSRRAAVRRALLQTYRL